jgi:hypothetical protein
MFRPVIRVDLSIVGYEAGEVAKVKFLIRAYESLTGRGIPRVPLEFFVNNSLFGSFETDENGVCYVNWSTSEVGEYSFIAQIRHLGRIWKSGEVKVGIASISILSYRAYDASVIRSYVTITGRNIPIPTVIITPCFGQTITLMYSTQVDNLPFRLGFIDGSSQVSPAFSFVPEGRRRYEVKGYYGYIPTRVDLSVASRSIGYDGASITMRGLVFDEVLNVGCSNYPYTFYRDGVSYSGTTDGSGRFEVKIDLYEGVYTVYASIYTGKVDNRTISSPSLSLRVCKTVFEVYNYITGGKVDTTVPITVMGVRVERPTFYIPYVSGETARVEIPSKYNITDSYLRDRFMDANIDGRAFDTNIIDYTLPMNRITARFAPPRMFFTSLDRAWDEKVSQCIAVRAIGLKARLVALHGLRFKFKDYVFDYMDGLKDGIFEFPTVEAYVRSCLCGNFYSLYYIDGLLPEYYGGYEYAPSKDIVEDRTGTVVGSFYRARAWWSNSPEVENKTYFTDYGGYFEIKLTKYVTSTFGGYLNYEFIINIFKSNLDRVLP